MSFLLGIVKLFLVIGCFKFANEADDWTMPAGLFAVGNFALFAMDGDFDLIDFVKLGIATALAFVIFFLLDRIDGLPWMAVVAIGSVLLLGI